MKQDLINNINNFKDLPYGLDGHSSIEEAIYFVEKYINTENLPLAKCDQYTVMLYWDNEFEFLEISFEGDGTYSYFTKFKDKNNYSIDQMNLISLNTLHIVVEEFIKRY